MQVKEKQKWTLMFFFASDNTLSPAMLNQLKSIKAAGFQLNTNVLAHFDPYERGVPSVIFEINRKEKEGQTHSRIGDEKDPVIRDLACDQVPPALTDADAARSYSYGGDNLTAEQTLINFLNFSRKYYPAENYMLFLVGHGMVVGGDAFLPDDNPDSGISLVKLGKLLWDFRNAIHAKGEVLQLLGMHSCSMSALEVAYQLKETATYMLGSEGLSFVGAWPYRQMLQKIFSTIEQARGQEVRVESLVEDLYELCLHSSADFIVAGYSSDLCLCSLEPNRVKALTQPIQTLSTALQAALDDDRGRELILLAHWKSQSYFQESYTDLYDLCLCLSQSSNDSTLVQQRLKSACDSVIEALAPTASNDAARSPILRADFVGPDCQYSHGLSIFFPWTMPVAYTNGNVIKNYETYAFVTELEDTSWLAFLKAYFAKTMRPARDVRPGDEVSYDYDATLTFAKSLVNPVALRHGPSEYASAALAGGKVSPSDASGYWIPSYIKNYPRDLSITSRALKVFANERAQTKTE